MKAVLNPFRSITALLALCLLALIGSAHAAPALVQKTGNYASSNTQLTLALNGVAAGDTLIVTFGTGAADTFISAADSSGNTVSAAVALAGSAGPEQGIYYVQNSSSGTHTITITVSASSNLTGFISEWSGLATSGVFDKASAVASSTSASISTASITPAVSGELVVFGVTQALSSDTFSSFTNGFTQQASYNTNGPSGTWASVVTGSAVNGGLTSSAANTSAATIAAFAPAAACTDAGQAQDGTISIPNGTSGLYLSPSGTWVTPDCSTIQYWRPPSGVCTSNIGVSNGYWGPTGQWIQPTCTAFTSVPPQGSAVAN
ncbi:MAG TPA: hypothetical protein VHY36_13420 [Steroidobacteraceae bacterium]|jgi:hypothetical protein|nr:hypothetical protein [Steroidobacteraceae bacterium]